MSDLTSYIREVPDFPKPGVRFYDITTLMQKPFLTKYRISPVAR